MLRHFQKLHTPLRSVHKYPDSHTQTQRFHDAGWDSVDLDNLWELWSDQSFLAPSQRLQLDSIEPFDEWEEFALFAAHYFLLTARTKRELQEKPGCADEEARSNVSTRTASASDQSRGTYSLEFVENPKLKGLRRSGALLRFPVGPGYTNTAWIHHGGMISTGRTSSSDVYGLPKTRVDRARLPPLRISARQCHTITRLNNGYSILIGGRTSPSAAMHDCYLQTETGWESIQDLPIPRFRHSAAAVILPNSIPGLLVFGGKSASNQVEHDVLLWDRVTGWRTLQVIRSGPQPRFGTICVALGDDFGFISGGMRADGVVLQDSWRWTFVYRDRSVIGIAFAPCSLKIDTGAKLFFGRFGASYSLATGQLLLIGGIASSGCIQNAYEVMSLDVSNFTGADARNELELHVSKVDVRRGSNDPRPMLVGSSAIDRAGTEVLIVGGGAVCFSFGTYWNPGFYILYESTAPACLDWALVNCSTDPPLQNSLSHVQSRQDQQTAVERLPNETTADFLGLVKQSQPKILEGLDFGPCRTLWTKEYLSRKIGNGRQVVVHEAYGRSMNFGRKDFTYVTKSFGVFLDEAYNGGHQYLRSISVSDPSKKVANLDLDFPEIAQDFGLPPELRLATDTYHSSPLRITGDVAMWLHVDIMANVLCQIQGSKRLILFPPADMVKLDFPPGSTTSNLEIFKDGDPNDIVLIPGTHPHEVILRPGDVLFIPPLWAHTAAPLQKMSIAVNVFFRNLTKGYAAGKDVYGNRDLEAYENGRRDVEKIARAFDGIPPDLAHAYLLRLAHELQSKAERYAPSWV
ncbi:hypothetical protein GJ744_006679 [Endocarpon pusillum]|uniref:tRNA wybutosine-synthesizing protein 4 n=1 Tax=Endocarpon pusillum TaxID=364733 RepID=A0A8H7E6N2_9EURO|nr:hypothetical protein GJ744_006679 [Endocarpon pusillum]